MKSLIFILFLLQSIWSSGIKSASKYAIDEKPVVRIDDHLQGIWKLAEDTNFHNYFVVEKNDDYEYIITYMNNGGDNRGLEHGRLFFSEVNGVKFINLPNWDVEHPGFILLKIKEIGTPRSWTLTANIVTDMAVTKVNSGKELRSLLEKNLNNASFYGKELHFRKKFEFNSFK